jgi:uncharacterized protein
MQNIRNSNLINKALEYAKELMKTNDSSHDWYHVERVWKNALFIAKEERCLDDKPCFDMEVIELAAIFHDIVDFKYDHDKGKTLEELANERLNNFFSEHEYPDDKIKKIIYIILNISWRKELEQNNHVEIPVELKIVRDSDRLESIQLFSYSGAINEPLYIDAMKPSLNMSAQEYNSKTLDKKKNDSTAINFFYEKLLLIKDKMQTKTGIRLAEQRHEFLLKYLGQFHDEINLI